MSRWFRNLSLCLLKIQVPCQPFENRSLDPEMS